MRLVHRMIDRLLSFGEYEGEPQIRRGGRRVLITALSIGILLTLVSIASDFAAGYRWVAISNIAGVVVIFIGLLAIGRYPRLFAWLINIVFGACAVFGMAVETTLFGGLYPSGLAPVFALIIVVGALVAIGIRAAAWWFGGFVVALLYSIWVPRWIEPLYVVEDATPDAIFNLAATGVVIFAAMIYFVRQRDRFQQESDDLLHNILPDAIANRLKSSHEMIAEDFAAVSILFADIVDFTPMSARMTAEELVGLLNDVFTRFDALVEELGLEKIKTVGDAYMVASGLPSRRLDHASALAELALRMRDTLAHERFRGHQIAMRIGINSGPVVAGIIGTRKFAYDLWGDAVNTASRMESGGLAGAIQVTEATHRLICDDFLCELRGEVEVKGKGRMPVYLVLDRRA